MTAVMRLLSVQQCGRRRNSTRHVRQQQTWLISFCFSLPVSRYGSPSRNLPAVTNYREPRNFDAGRQQAALPPVRMPSKSHESVQHPYSSNRNNRMSDRRPSPPRQRYPPERHPSPDSYRSSTSYEGPPANYFDDSARKTSFNAKPQYNEGICLINLWKWGKRYSILNRFFFFFRSKTSANSIRRQFATTEWRGILAECPICCPDASWIVWSFFQQLRSAEKSTSVVLH